MHAIVRSEDTQVLLALAGITSVCVNTASGLQQAYAQACEDTGIAILAVSQGLLPQLAPPQGKGPVIVPLFLEA